MNLASKISVCRIFLAPFFIASVVYYNPASAVSRSLPLIIFCLGMISDGVDGIIARRWHQRSHLGEILDPLADKTLIITALVCLSTQTALPAIMRLPAWVPIIIISRDLILILGSVVVFLVTGAIRIRPSKLGKLSTVLQMLTVVSAFLVVPYRVFLWYAAALCTIISGIHYIQRESKILNKK